MTVEKVRALLRQACAKAGGQGRWAAQNGMSGVYVSDILSGRREPAGKVLTALGLERVVSYRRARVNGG